jgi:hypothetical protein
MARTAGRRTCETLASDPGQADQTGSAGGARKPGPGRQIVSQDNASASAESKVRPGPRPLTLRPHHRKTAEAGPEALSTVSLPNTRSFTGHPLGRMRDADYLFFRTTVCLYLLMLPGGLRVVPREPGRVEHHLLGRAQVRCAWVSSRLGCSPIGSLTRAVFVSPAGQARNVALFDWNTRLCSRCRIGLRFPRCWWASRGWVRLVAVVPSSADREPTKRL